MATEIHPTAVVDPRAELGEEVRIGPYAVIRAGVRLGGRWVGASRWVDAPACRAFRADIVADGRVTAAVRLRWDFAAQAGLAGDVPAFAEVTFVPVWTLMPRFLNVRSSSFDTASSSEGTSAGSSSMMVTSLP